MKKFSLKTFWDILYGVIFIFLLFIAGTVIFSMLNIPGGYKLYTVQSGSMEPTVKTGSLIISKSFDDYQVGEIITYKSLKEKDSKNPKLTTTHRITEKKDENNKIFYITKGDANNVADIEPISSDLVLGKTILILPYLGYPVSAAKTQNGLIIFIIIPATLIVYSELLSIKNETTKLIQAQKKKKLNIKEKIELEIGEEEIKAEKGIKKWFKKIFKKK